MITRRLSSRPAGSLTRALWTCPSCTRSSLVPQTKASSIRIESRRQRRSIHHVPPLAYDDTFTASGVPGLLSPAGYSIAWTQYQDLLVKKLNQLTSGQPYENDRPKDLTLKFARDPMNANLFNYASAAHNNHKFFETLASFPKPLKNVPLLQASLENTFGSIETLRATMLDTAAAMFGPGYVWLVWAKDTDRLQKRNWRILTTYLAGTPYAEAGYRQQGIDMASNNASSFQDYRSRLPVANTAGAFGPHSAAGREEAKLPPGGTSVMPVLCVSTWEHTYIYDYGLAGKREFLDDWWAAVDWGVVHTNAPAEAKESAVGYM